jgi:hypothetical protein
MVPPPEVLEAASRWAQLTRWERAELGRGLRLMGWTYSEIMAVLPVVKGTLAGWCKEIRLTDQQIDAIKARVPTQKGVPRDTNRKRRLEISQIREQARAEMPQLLDEPLWIAGTVLYWGEGFKAQQQVGMSNSDPAALRLFIRWVRTYVKDDAEFVCKLNLHYNNDEPAARHAWAEMLGMADIRFYRTFIKPEGTGHRKNHLAHGVCQVSMRRSGDSWHRIAEWIDALKGEWAN